jgi:hypothetical protein
MIRWSESNYSLEKQQNTIAGWFAAIFICALLALAINAWATSSGGYDDQEHRGPVPVGVQQINPNVYIATRGNPVLLSQICWGGKDPNSSGVTRESYPTSLGGRRYIECERGQKWNVHRKPKPSFWHAAFGTLTTPGWLAPVIIAVSLLLLYPLALTVGSWHAGTAGRKAKRRAKKQKPADLEQKRRELVRAYTKDEINDLEFQMGLDKLYAQGLPRAGE